MVSCKNISDKAYSVSLEARKKAYAPYSQFQVGAALKLINDDQIYTGCNVENASYGATVCAERTAILKAISESREKVIEFIIVTTDTDPVATPCGMCLQVILEFSDQNTQVYLANLKGIQKTLTLKELLPYQFDRSSLPHK